MKQNKKQQHTIIKFKSIHRNDLHLFLVRYLIEKYLNDIDTQLQISHQV